MSNSLALHCRTMLQQGATAWLVCLSAGLFFLYEFLQLNLFDVMSDTLLIAFDLNTHELSWLSSAYLWANILFLIPAGVILDKFSVRRVILCAMFVCVLGTLGFAFSKTYSLAFICHFLTGIGNAFCFLSCVVLISRWFPPKQQALLIGCVVTMAFLGGALAHTPVAYFNAHYGWRTVLLIDAGLGGVILVWLFYILQDSPGAILRSDAEKVSVKSVFKRQNILAGLYTAYLNLPIIVLCALWGSSYLRTVHQLSAMTASNIVSLIFIGSMLGCPLMGLASDLWGKRKPVMVIGAALSLLVILPLFLPLNVSLVELALIFFFLGFFSSAQVISYPLIAESNSPTHTGLATGVASVIIMTVGALAQIVFGWVVKIIQELYPNDAISSAYQSAMWLLPITLVLALFLLLFIQETNGESFKKQGG